MRRQYKWQDKIKAGLFCYELDFRGIVQECAVYSFGLFTYGVVFAFENIN